MTPARPQAGPEATRRRRRVAGFALIPALVVTGLGSALLSSPAAAAGGAQGDAAFGEYLSGECVSCHQVSGRYQGIPSIVGWPEGSFVEIMNEYRHKRRANPIMQTIAARLSDEEVAALAAYFGGLKPKP